MLKQKESTSCYTYEVVLTVQVLAESLTDANIKVEAEGGHVSRRQVTLKDTVKLYDGSEESDKGKTEV